MARLKMENNFNQIVIGTTVNKDLNPVVEKLKDREILLCDSETSINDIGVKNTNVSTHLINNVSESKNNGIGFARNSLNGFKAFKSDTIFNMKLKNVLNDNVQASISPPGGTGSAGFAYLLDFVDDEAVPKNKINYVFPLLLTADEIAERKYYSIFVKAETTDNIGEFNFMLVAAHQLPIVVQEYSPRIHSIISSELINRISSQGNNRCYLVLDIKSEDTLKLKNDFEVGISHKGKQLLLKGNNFDNNSEFQAALNNVVEIIKKLPEIETSNLNADKNHFLLNNTSYNGYKSYLEEKVNYIYLETLNQKLIPLKKQLYSIIKKYGYGNCKSFITDIKKFANDESKKYSSSISDKIFKYYKQETSFIAKTYYKLKKQSIQYDQLEASLQGQIYFSIMKSLYNDLDKLDLFFSGDTTQAIDYDWVSNEEVNSIIDYDFIFDSQMRINKIKKFLDSNVLKLIQNYLLNIPHSYGFQINNSSKNREGVVILSDDLAGLNPDEAREFRIKYQKKFNLVISDYVRILPSNNGKIQVIFWAAAYKEEIEFYNKLLTKYNDKINDPNSVVPPYFNSLKDVIDIFPVRLRANGIPQTEDVNLAFLHLILTPGLAVFRKKSFYVNIINKEFSSLDSLHSLTIKEEDKIRRKFYEYFLENKKKVFNLIELLCNEKQQGDVRKNVNKYLGPRKLKETVRKLNERLKYLDKNENESVF